MSLGTFQFPESYCRTRVSMNAAEHEVGMILADMHNQPMMQDQETTVHLTDEASKQNAKIYDMINKINQKKFAERKDSFLHAMKMEFLQEPEHDPAVPQLSLPKALTPASTAKRQKRSRVNSSYRLKKLSKSTQDLYKTPYSLRTRSTQAKSHVVPTRSTRSRSKRVQSLPALAAEPSTPSISKNFEPKQLPTPKTSPLVHKILHAGLDITPAVSQPSFTNSSTPTAPSSKRPFVPTPPSTPPPSPATTPPSTRHSTAPSTPASSSTAPPVPGTWPGHTYPEMLTRAIRESADGRLHVQDLYSAVAQYDPNCIARIELRIIERAARGPKKTKRKPAVQIFQENVRQNLSRRTFRRIEGEAGAGTGPGGGLWELVEVEVPEDAAASSPSKSKRKRAPARGNVPYKRAKRGKK